MWNYASNILTSETVTYHLLLVPGLQRSIWLEFSDLFVITDRLDLGKLGSFNCCVFHIFAGAPDGELLVSFRCQSTPSCPEVAIFERAKGKGRDSKVQGVSTDERKHLEIPFHQFTFLNVPHFNWLSLIVTTCQKSMSRDGRSMQLQWNRGSTHTVLVRMCSRAHLMCRF